MIDPKVSYVRLIPENWPMEGECNVAVACQNMMNTHWILIQCSSYSSSTCITNMLQRRNIDIFYDRGHLDATPSFLVEEVYVAHCTYH